jgi:predicted ArsR family transcriptional regulator
MALTKTQVRKQVGRKAFTIPQFAASTGASVSTARRQVLALAEAGGLEIVGQVDPQAREGEKRGRPATQFRVVAGK